MLNCVTRVEDEPGVNAVNTVNHQGKWEVIKCKVDSGAVDWVTSPEIGAAFQMNASTASKKGINYQAANGTVIKNYGERVIKGLTDDWNNVEVAMQVADVKSTLGSVWRMTQAGNKVVFGDEDAMSYIENKKTGKRTWLSEVNGSYEFDLWVAAKQSANPKQSANQLNSAVKVSNRYEVLNASDFPWLDEIF
jgi:hypothetical protein